MTSAPTFKEIFRGIWTMTSLMLRQAPILILILLLIPIAAEAAKITVPADTLTNKTLRTLLYAVQCIVTAPVHFALYRLLLLAEKPSGYRFDYRSSRFRKYLAWTMILYLLSEPIMFLDFEDGSERLMPIVAIAGIVFFLVVVFVVLRTILLLPALAVGRSDVSLRDILLDSRGRFWRICKIVLVGLVFVLAIFIPGLIVVGYADIPSDIADISDWRAWTRAVFDGAIAGAIELPMLAAGALTFVWIGDRVKRGMPEYLAEGVRT